ncbi:putative sugar nucleotidyl transferase [Chitinophaga sancti]|uniref:Sugar nucleotidyl transferase n=1 Tax=Chitinophaga sancti TaxID=1004 RepID=A0A1K1LVX2_9BACT|nr:putative sugar nucleotidyl transferase [Chitinophaga sancti]WQD64803.1 putative sugar nucleotidyl transferase [Chitinophaga sancti]WQG89573.1 putative sugar nucleotidyl transferase [Chitinophaga sancti]SFW15015.1 UDP-N-acetylglucosamine diphosphorylase/glucosamine-1-phosphate N-acetyltransferase [Chitinophaga sancti]
MERRYILFDTPARDLLYPFTHTRPVAAIRVGILTIREKWERWLNASASFLTLPYLQEKFPLQVINAEDQCVLINGHVLPDRQLVAAVQALRTGQELYREGMLVAKVVVAGSMRLEGRGLLEAGGAGSLGVDSLLAGDSDLFAGDSGHPGGDSSALTVHHSAAVEHLNYQESVQQLTYPWDIFRLNDSALRQDFSLLTEGRISAPIPGSNQVSGAENIFLEPGAVVEHSILNGKTGPIYIAKGAEVMEGCLIRGPLALCEGAVLKMGTKIYGATTLGPGSVGGGEIKNVVMLGYSNKGHDGYLGDAVLGEWCNLGGNTTNSNLKNNAGTVRVWVEAKNEAIPAGTKCGLIMGDYSRSGIGTMFNTGTVIGVSCNIFGSEFPPKFVPSFSWGGVQPEPYREMEALRDARQWMRFKGQELGDVEERLLKAVYTKVKS